VHEDLSTLYEKLNVISCEEIVFLRRNRMTFSNTQNKFNQKHTWIIFQATYKLLIFRYYLLCTFSFVRLKAEA